MARAEWKNSITQTTVKEHAHHWVIEYDENRNQVGTCKHCEAQREFRPELEDWVKAQKNKRSETKNQEEQRTNQSLQIAELLLQGYGPYEIASVLGISRQTISERKSHFISLYGGDADTYQKQLHTGIKNAVTQGAISNLSCIPDKEVTLSPEQESLANAIAHGHTIQQIEEMHDLSRQRVINMRDTIFRQFGIRNSYQLAAWFGREDLKKRQEIPYQNGNL